MIVAGVSCYREGPPLTSTVRSALAGADMVLVLEGPAGAQGAGGPESPLPELRQLERVMVAEGEWGSDAEKRTALLGWARELRRSRSRFAGSAKDPLWLLALDGDELLIWGEYLSDWLLRAEQEDGEQTGTGGWAIRIVELDGSVGLAYNKVVRADRVRSYVHSGYQVTLEPSGMIVALPVVPLCAAGGVPLRPDELAGANDVSDAAVREWLGRSRPPLAGEPHILHRSGLRAPGRDARRLSDVEAEWFLEQPGAALPIERG